MERNPLKIIVRRADGKILKGYSKDFSPEKPVFHLSRERTGTEKAEEINLFDLKAVFFVDTLASSINTKGIRKFAETDILAGRKAEIVFKDGEILQGRVMKYNPSDSGFFFFWVGPSSYKMQAFIVNTAVETFNYLEEDPVSRPDKSNYQSLIPEIRGKLLMVNDQERRVLRLVLSQVLKSESGREYIIETLGKVYLQIAERLLEEMEK